MGYRKGKCCRVRGLSAYELKIQIAIGAIDINGSDAWEVAYMLQSKNNTSPKVLNVLADIAVEPHMFGWRYLILCHPNTSRSTRLRMRRLLGYDIGI